MKKVKKFEKSTLDKFQATSEFKNLKQFDIEGMKKVLGGEGTAAASAASGQKSAGIITMMGW